MADPSRAVRPITCVIADDHPPLREILSAILPQHGIDVVAVASDGEEAVTAIAAHRPRVAILDLMMPHLDGIEVARRAAHIAPETGVVLYTGYADGSFLLEALRAGALGFVSKGAPTDELIRAIELVADGGAYVDPRVAARVDRV